MNLIKTSLERLLSLILFKPLYPSVIEFRTFDKIDYKKIKKMDELDTSLTRVIDFDFFQKNSQIIFSKWIENYHKNHITIKDYLKKRLKEILKRSILCDKIDNIDLYSKKLKITRNYYAHLEEEHKEESFTSTETHYNNYLLEYLIREILLNEIGITEELNIPHNVKKCLSLINDE